MDISAVGGNEYLDHSVFPEFKAGGDDGARIDQIFKKMLEIKDTNGDGALDQSEFKIPEDKFLKMDSSGNSLIDPEELQAGVLEKLNQLKALMAGNEGMLAEIQGKVNEAKEASEQSEGFLVEIPLNGIDDDKDGEIDEEVGSSLYDITKDEDSAENSDSGGQENIFDILI